MSTLLSSRCLATPLTAAIIAASLMAGVAHADPPGPTGPPPVPTIPPFRPPPVFCFRITDIADVPGDPEGNRFAIEFEVLNWTNQDMFGLDINKAVDLRGPTFGGNPFISGASVDGNGRPFGLGNDDANFSPADGTGLPAKIGTPNPFVVGGVTPSSVSYFTVGAPIVPRDLLGAPGTSVAQTTAALSLVPGAGNFVDPFGRPVIPDFETIDNGALSVDGLPDNVRDGFVIEIDDFDPGEVVSLNWFQLDSSGVPTGTAQGGNAYGFGLFNLSRGADLPALWQRGPGSQFGRGQNSGAFLPGPPFPPTRDQFVSVSSPSGAVFVPEFGAALTAPFENPNDQCPTCDVDALDILPPVFIPTGTDFFHTRVGETFFASDQNPNNPSRLQGIPIPDPDFQNLTGSTEPCIDCDTIVRRLQDLDPIGPPLQSVPIEMIALSLQSIDPIDLGVGGGPENFEVHLGPSAGQNGQLTVDFEKRTLQYQFFVNVDIIGDNGTFLPAFAQLSAQGQFSQEQFDEQVIPGLNENFLPLPGLTLEGPVQVFPANSTGEGGGDGIGGPSFYLVHSLGVPIVAPGIPGDFDGDGDVDLDDFGVFVNDFQNSPQGGPPFAPGDFDEDGDVDLDDFGVFVNSFQNFPPGPSTSVPEPGAAALLLTALGATTLRRRVG